MKKLVGLYLLSFIYFAANSNNIQVANVKITGQNLGSHYTFVQFDLTWDNSFRIAAGAQNWDAAWVFVKFQITGGTGCTASTTWNHATLSATSTDHSVTTNNGISPQIDAVSDSRGVFMYRLNPGTGSINWQTCLLRWNYGTDGVLDACSVTVKVFAVEMIYVPTSGFSCGDGVIGGQGRLEGFPYGAGTVFSVSSATTPTVLGGNTSGSMGNNNTNGQSVADDFNTGTSKALPAAYPNGFNKFFCMKYEISQEQYSEFLNTLNGTQQAQRTPAIVVGQYFANAAGFTTPQSRNGIKCQIAPVGAIPGQFGLDLNNNGTFNEVNGDGRYIACDWLSYPDLAAYLDWSGLRPMTEMEYEKASRGTLIPNTGEFAWGTNAITGGSAVSNGGADNELVTTVGANASYNNLFATGPFRCGVFATGSTTRITAGASYYGIMELTGNVWEDGVSLGSAAGRSYTGVHGNGALNAAGAADVDFWPGINGNNTYTSANTAYGGTTGCTGYAGIGFMGGSWRENAYLPVSDRQYKAGWTGLGGRDNRNGGRGVRTAP